MDMSWDLRQLLLGIHIFLGIIWFGGVLFIGWGVFPASNKLKPSTQREFLSHLMNWVHLPFTFVGVGVIATGTILATIGGPLKSWDAVISTTYGQLYSTALIVAVFTLLWGIFVGYRYAMHIFSNQELWINREQGSKRPLQRAFFKIAVLESIEIIGFLTILTCMILI